MDTYTLTEFLDECSNMLDDDPEGFKALTADGFDQAIMGAGQLCGRLVVIYDLEKVYQILMSWDMSYESAVEYYDFNIAGAIIAIQPSAPGTMRRYPTPTRNHGSKTCTKTWVRCCRFTTN